MASSEFVGVDGCKGGWFSVGLNVSNWETKVFPSFGELLHFYSDAELVLVDIPIGLPEGEGGRDCDREAREKLGRPARVKRLPNADSPGSATGVARARGPRDCRPRRAGSRRERNRHADLQHRSKIAEVDEVMRTRGAKRATPVVREVHPELLFWALNGGKPMESSKKGKPGRDERLRVLQRCTEPTAQEIYEAACCKFRQGKSLPGTTYSTRLQQR